MNHIELFAGCGGLSLGLKSVGFNLLMANELSPMASETFAYNFFDVDLTDAKNHKHPEIGTRSQAMWLSSIYPREQMKERLRENPHNFKELGQGISDIRSAADLQENLVVGSIIHLNQWLDANPDAAQALKEGFDGYGVDLVSGGPPCQSFSMAGMREYSNKRNSLPKEFADFVKKIQPRMALLENVSGILRPFNVDGRPVHAWYEVAKAFVATGYVPLCLHVNAKYAGVAQSRPRFLMILFRYDIYKSLSNQINEAENSILAPSGIFYEAANKDPELEFGSLPYFDVESGNNMQLFKKTFLEPLVHFSEQKFTTFDAIDDLKVNSGQTSEYVYKLNEILGQHIKRREKSDNTFGKNKIKIDNHEHRKNGALVRRRFRIYQILGEISPIARKEVQAILNGESSELSKPSHLELCGKDFLGDNEKFFKPKPTRISDLVAFLEAHQTKKRTQKALIAMEPAPAALSIPDDACHYEELRTLTVREMARFQSFPDKFTFRSKVTTGGQNRKFEVPQYTQVGNAVPPLLGRAIGQVIEKILIRANKDSSFANAA